MFSDVKESFQVFSDFVYIGQLFKELLMSIPDIYLTYIVIFIALMVLIGFFKFLTNILS